MADIEPIYYLIAVVIFFITTVITKQWNFGLLCGYMFFVLSVTVLNRKAFIGIHFQPKLLWSWSAKDFPIQREQILMNVIGFAPVGALLASVLQENGRSVWLAVPIATGYSLFIELLQLATSRGLFEFDDILHNSLGAVIGVTIYILLIQAMDKKDINEVL